MEEALKRLLEKMKKEFTQIRECSLEIVQGGSTALAAQNAVKAICPCWKGEIKKDGYGAPYLSFHTQALPISISVAEEKGAYFCLAALHDGSLGGIGLDVCSIREFRTAISGGKYQAGSLFTKGEQSWLAAMRPGRFQADSDTAQRMILAEIFSGKEAAFKSLNEAIRRKLPPGQEQGFYGEFLEMEVLRAPGGERYGKAFGRTAKLVSYLGIDRFWLATVWAGELAVTAAAPVWKEEDGENSQ